MRAKGSYSRLGRMGFATCFNAMPRIYWIVDPLMSQTITVPGTSPGIEISGEDVKSPLYRVVLLDDDDHTYDYVIEMLQKVFVFSMEQALRHAQEVDAQGRTILMV